MPDYLSSDSQPDNADLDVNTIIETAVAMSERLSAEPKKTSEPVSLATPSRSDSFTTQWRRRWTNLNLTQRFYLIFSAGVICFGLLFSWYMKTDYEKRLASQEWPVVTGTVTGADTFVHTESSEYGPDRSHYHARLAIEYVVNDVRYRVELEDNAHGYNTEDEALAAHRRETKHQLYVNPANPAEAVLYFDKLPLGGWIGTSQCIMAFCVFVALLLLLLARSSGVS